MTTLRQLLHEQGEVVLMRRLATPNEGNSTKLAIQKSLPRPENISYNDWCRYINETAKQIER
jgi:hypothetical protein